jgi:hypothetical protein
MVTARHFTGSNLTKNATLDIYERVYYMRALIGVAGGIVAGVVIPVEFDQYTSIGTAIFVGIVFYFASLGIGRRIAKNVPRDKRKKVATEGIMPFIFLLLTFMIMVYTVLHQSSVVS